MKIGIVGYGYVGRGIERMFQARSIISIYDPAQRHRDKSGVRASDLVVICVPTPRLLDGRAHTLIVEDAVADFAEAKLICIKSTVPPGTTETLIKRWGDHIHFSPEYMGEGGNYVPPQYLDRADPRAHPFCIVGGRRPGEVLAFFQKVMATSARYIETSATAAELCKYMENAYLATKVAFCNELAAICEAQGVSYNQVRDLWLADPRVDPSHTLVFPDQRGFSGKCLPKDLSALRSFAQVATPLLDGVSQYDLSKRPSAPQR